MRIAGRAVLVASIWVVAGQLLVACGVFGPDGPMRDEAGVVVEPGELEPYDLQLGDCFDQPDSEVVELVTAVPCSDLHDREVYHTFMLPEGEYPGDDVIQTEWTRGCLAEFENFVGSPYDDSLLDISAIIPTERTWNELGDREVLCSIMTVDGSPRQGSARSSRL